MASSKWRLQNRIKFRTLAKKATPVHLAHHVDLVGLANVRWLACFDWQNVGNLEEGKTQEKIFKKIIFSRFFLLKKNSERVLLFNKPPFKISKREPRYEGKLGREKKGGEITARAEGVCAMVQNRFNFGMFKITFPNKVRIEWVSKWVSGANKRANGQESGAVYLCPNFRLF